VRQTKIGHIGLLGWGVLLASLALMLAWPAAAWAEFIAGFPDAPGGSESHTNIDITNFSLSVSYNGSTHVISATSLFDYDAWINDGNEELDGTGDLSLQVTIDPSNGNPLNGTMSISGDAYGGSAGNLLTGTISQFGFALPADAMADQSSEHFQFIFNTTSGDLASYFPSIAVNMTAVNLHSNGGSFTTNGTFATSFGSTGYSAQTDTYAAPTPTPTPEPATLTTLGCLGIVVLIARYRILCGTRMLCWGPRG